MSATKTDQAIGNRIRIIRISRNLSQENMAEELGLSVGAYSNLERGKTEFTINRYFQIGKILKMDKNDLFDLLKENFNLSNPEKYTIQNELENIKDELKDLKNLFKGKKKALSKKK